MRPGTILAITAILLSFAIAGCKSNAPSNENAADSAVPLSTETSTENVADSAVPLTPGTPNFVIILADDLGYGDVGFHGSTEARTPNLDRFAAGGIQFTNGYVASSYCSPSRAAILTGRHPAKTGWEINPAYNPLDHHLGLSHDEILFPEYLQQAGYKTGIVGKWHLGAALPFNPLGRGFDYFWGILMGSHHYFESNPLDTNYSKHPISNNGGAEGFDGYLTDAFTDKAIEFVEENSQNPFFLYMSYTAPHGPYQAPAELIDSYSHIPDRKKRTYLAMVESLDRNIGRLIQTLEDQGVRDNTVVFFLNDNGGREIIGSNGPLRGKKNTLYEGGIRVPFLASWPRQWPQGIIYEPMISSMDLAPTILGLADINEIDPDHPLDGVNLDPYLLGEGNTDPHETLFWRSGYYGKDRGAIRSGDWKLIAEGKGTPELYNLAANTSETRDLSEENNQQMKALAELWNEWNADNLPGSWIERQDYKARLEEWMENEAEYRQQESESREIYQMDVN